MCTCVFQSLGQLGKVTKVFGSGDLRVDVNGASWTFNPLCLVPAPGENPPDVPGINMFVMFKWWCIIYRIRGCFHASISQILQKLNVRV